MSVGFSDASVAASVGVVSGEELMRQMQELMMLRPEQLKGKSYTPLGLANRCF